MRRRTLALPLAALLLAPACATGPVMNIHAGGTGSEDAPCVAEVEGRRIAPADFPALARRWRGREAQLTFDARTPYRCVGGVIYELQRAGFRRIGFVSEPAETPGQ